MAIRERNWFTSSGEVRSAWIVDYTDQNGKRHQKTFKLKRDAKRFESGTHIEVLDKVHVADSDTVTIAEAGKLWIAACEEAGHERTTVAQYTQHLNLHIIPFIGDRRLNEFTVPVVRAFIDKLRNEGRSPAMLRNVRVSLGSILSDAQDRGLVVRNAVKETGRSKAKNGTSSRHERPPEVGVDIPTTAEIRSILKHSEGRVRVFLMTAIFTGMRASELRGLRWTDVDLARGELTVRQRADAHGEIGSPKSRKGRRTIPLVSDLVKALKSWKLECPNGPENLVFPNNSGNIEWHANIIKRWFHPAQIAAGVTMKIEKNGKELLAPKYTGLHSLRHFYASWCINRTQDGGLGLPAKVVQERMGHSSITVTLNTYSHLFPRNSDSAMDAAESAILG